MTVNPNDLEVQILQHAVAVVSSDEAAHTICGHPYVAPAFLDVTPERCYKCGLALCFTVSVSRLDEGLTLALASSLRGRFSLLDFLGVVTGAMDSYRFSFLDCGAVLRTEEPFSVLALSRVAAAHALILDAESSWCGNCLKPIGWNDELPMGRCTGCNSLLAFAMSLDRPDVTKYGDDFSCLRPDLTYLGGARLVPGESAYEVVELYVP